jgi:hypothetical protein
LKKSAKKNNYAKSKLEQKIAPAQEKAPPTLVNTSQEQAISRKAPEKINSPASQENKKVVAPSASTKPKIAPAIAIRPDFKIFQIYFEPWQKDLLDGAFTPIDNAKFPSELREFDVFTRLANSEYVKGAKLWGALSWRFTEKTGMTSADLVKEINAFPDHDIYFCNPQPEYEALYHNLWLQGVPSHPQFLEVSQAFFRAVGLPLESLMSIEPIAVTSSANFFVATPQFWSLYIPWIQNLLNTANKKMPPTMRDLMHSPVADDKNLHGGATYVPFIVERLLPIFLKTVGSQLKAHKCNLIEPLKKMDVHLRLLREMKDVAHRTNSPWLAACWANYRNLYLTQTKGAQWCKTYLRQITPEKIIF